MKSVSVSPEGRSYSLPTEEDNKKEEQKLKELVSLQRKKGRGIVAVQGLGFVGAVMGAVIADSQDERGNPYYYVLGVQRPSERSFWKIHSINEGKSPVKGNDPGIPKIFHRIVKEKETFYATWLPFAFSLSDIVVIDIQLDAKRKGLGKGEESSCDLRFFKDGIEEIGREIRPETLVLIETTVPPGTTLNVVKPILEREFQKRGIDIQKHPVRLAHSYERVMPGKNYLSSIRDFWRSYAGVDEESSLLTEKFLKRVIDTKKFPLSRLSNPTASELAKTLENSFRATNIALLYEWALFSEDIGVNLFEILDAIRVRPTHKNILQPGLGVGGYCLTKDPLLANWSSKTIFDRKEGVPFAVQAVDINDLMPFHTLDLIKEALSGNIKGKKIHILGASYRQSVGDTRHSPSETLWKAIENEGGIPSVHDPLVETWPEVPHARIEKDLLASLKDKDVIVFAVKHREYYHLNPEDVFKSSGKTPVIIDARNILNDVEIKRYLSLSCKVKGLGKGHIKKFDTNFKK